MAASLDKHVKFPLGVHIQNFASQLLLQEALTTNRSLTWDIALVADCLYANNWREA